MRMLIVILLSALSCLLIPSVSKALPVLTVTPFDQICSDNRLMMIDGCIGVDDYILSSMLPGEETLWLGSDLYNNLDGYGYTSNSVNELNVPVHTETKKKVPKKVEEIEYRAMGFALDSSDELFLTRHFVEESSYLQRSKINPVTGKSWNGSVEEQNPAPELVSIPATVLLLGSGLIGLIGFKRKSKRVNI